MADASHVRRHARGRWPQLLGRLGVPAESLTNRHSPCPGCGGRDRFRFDDRDGDGTFLCGRGGGEPLAGDGFALLQHVLGWTFPETVNAVAGELGLSAEACQPAKKPVDARPQRAETGQPSATPAQSGLSEQARSTWRATMPIEPGTIAAKYLEGRGCALPPAGAHVRYHPSLPYPETGERYPALVAAVTHAVTLKPLTLHRTWLAPDGSGKAPVEKPRLVLRGHPKAGGVIRLWPDEDVTLGLGVAEGIESALTAAHAFQPVWAAIDAGGVGNLQIMRGIEALTIFADADQAGRQAAGKCAARWHEAGTEVRIWQAPEEGADLNDVYGSAAA